MLTAMLNVVCVCVCVCMCSTVSKGSCDPGVLLSQEVRRCVCLCVCVFVCAYTCVVILV